MVNRLAIDAFTDVVRTDDNQMIAGGLLALAKDFEEENIKADWALVETQPLIIATLYEAARRLNGLDSNNPKSYRNETSEDTNCY